VEADTDLMTGAPHVIDLRIDLRSLEAFYWVVKLGNFHKAADKLITCQPAISRRIEELEESLGKGSLLDRKKRPFVLTEIGETIFAYAEQLLALHGEMLSKVSDDPSELRGTLNLGVAETIVHSWLSRFLQQMHATYPRLALALDVDISASLKTRLLEQKIDLAFMVGPVDDDTLCTHPLNTERLAFLASPTYDLPPRTTLSAIAQHPIITFPRNTRPFKRLRDLFSDPSDRPLIHASASVATIVKMAVEGLGVAVLPPSIVQEEKKSGRLVELSCEASLPDLELFASWHSSPVVGHIDALVQIASAVAAEHQLATRD
jgi:DNA-binding transcriptional LysR family regulator